VYKRQRGLGDVYKRQSLNRCVLFFNIEIHDYSNNNPDCFYKSKPKLNVPKINSSNGCCLIKDNGCSNFISKKLFCSKDKIYNTFFNQIKNKFKSNNYSSEESYN
jgi:hypothetical protein